MWDDMDNANNLRDTLARVIGSKASGLSLETVIPSQFDYELADSLSDLIDKEIEEN